MISCRNVEMCAISQVRQAWLYATPTPWWRNMECGKVLCYPTSTVFFNFILSQTPDSNLVLRMATA